jgi:acid phosphatase type 7
MQTVRTRVPTASSARRIVLLVLALTALWWGPAAHSSMAATVAAVGDMACPPNDPDYNNGAGTATRCRQRYVSDVVVNMAPDALLDLGDNQYFHGELANYKAVYDPTFGRLNPVVYPSLGNAEYDTTGATGFFDYFSSVGVSARLQALGSTTSAFSTGGYYSFDLGQWHVIALNSNCAQVGGCGSGSAQEKWLRDDLAAHAHQCTLAYWHHPRWNTGRLGNDPSTAAFWTDLYNANADIVLNGHGNHHYERFKPQDPTGAPNATEGIREFIVSTGGESHGTPPATTPSSATSEVTDYTSFGALKLNLTATGYDWQFIPEVGGSFTDSGSGPCHAATSTVPAAPTLTATGGAGASYLSWTAPADGGAPITGYRIYRGTSSGSEALLDTVGKVQAYDDYSAVNGTTYYYRVTAVNAAGESATSNEVSDNPAAAPAPSFPSTPVLDDFKRSTGALGSNWQSPSLADPGTVSISASGLTASSSQAGSALWTAGTFAADQEAYLTLPVLPAESHFVQLAARVSGSSSTTSCYLLRVTPSTSTWDLRRKVNGAASTSIKTFKAPLSAGDTIGLEVTGSTLTALYRAQGQAWRAVGSATSTSVPGSGTIGFTLGDNVGRGGSFGGGATTTASVPAAPTLTATAGDGKVSLSWQAPSNGGSTITGYNVYRGTSSGGETLLQSVGSGTSFDDTTAANGTTYYYRVSAVNSIGEGARSNEVSATPTAPVTTTFPSTPVLDDFARASGPLGSNWRSPALTDTGTVSIVTSGMTAGSAGASSATWSAQSFGADEEAYLTVPTLPRAGNFVQVAVRVSTLGTTNISCYFLRVTPSTGTWDLRKKVRGGTSTSIQTFTTPFSAGDAVGLKAKGSTLTVYDKPQFSSWSVVGTASDTSITAGGWLTFTLGDTTARGGSFGGGAAA